MSDDLVKRLRGPSGVKDWQTAIHIYAKDAREAADRIEALEAALAKADELANVFESPVRSDDGFYDYFQHDVDPLVAAYRAAREATK